MKRLFTLVFLAIFVLSTSYAQLPMVVKGKMKVAATGNLKSLGTIHVKADETTTGINGAILNEGVLTVNSGQNLIFYSNDKKDGLLLNKTANGVSTSNIKVRKKFATTNKWYTMSFPFEVDLTNVYIIKNGVRTQATLWTDFAVAYYDAEKRAQTGLSTGNWTMYSSEGTTTLPAGKACRIATEFTGVSSCELEFNAPASAITDLLAYTDKSVPVTYYKCELYLNPENSSGWNVIGGRSFSAFDVVAGTTLSFLGPIHFYDQDSGDWIQFPNDSGIPSTVTISPYVTYYAQLNSDATTQITYNTSGYSLNNATPAGFRSSEEDLRDIFALSINKDRSTTDNLYIMLGDDYKEDFVIEEDGLKLFNEENSNSPKLWSYNKMNNGTYSLFLDRLPRTDTNREIELGISIPASGEYTFELKEYNNRTVQSATLLDKEKNEEIDMLTSSYVVNLEESDNISDRFVLIFNAPTSLADVTKESDIYAYVENNTLTIKRLNSGNSIKIADLTGRTIFTGIATSDEFQTSLIQKGAYIINVSGDKNAIIKVLNQ